MCSSDLILVGVILDSYASARAGKVRGGATMANCMERLATFWGNKTPADVDEAHCAAYAKERADGYTDAAGRLRTAGPDTVRRDLGVLQSALLFAKESRILATVYNVTLPPAGDPRDRALTRQEAAWLLFAAAPHVRRFVVLALYTGRRATAILELRWARGPGGGWIDLARGAIDFKNPARKETKKRRGAVAAPRQLLAHARRWRRLGGARPIEWRGKAIKEIDTAFRAACRRAEETAARRGVALDLSDVSPHTLKHTSVTWFFARGGSLEDAVSYFATSARTLESVYRKHSPEHQKTARAVWERRRD